jgi:hypothetical protein
MMTRSEPRTWNEGEQELLKERFTAVWEEVSSKVTYEVSLDCFTKREAIFLAEAARIFVRPRRTESVRRQIGGKRRTVKRDTLAIFTEHRVSGGPTLPEHLDEYMQDEVIGPGSAAVSVVTLPVVVAGESTVESEQYADMPTGGVPSGDIPNGGILSGKSSVSKDSSE